MTADPYVDVTPVGTPRRSDDRRAQRVQAGPYDVLFELTSGPRLAMGVQATVNLHGRDRHAWLSNAAPNSIALRSGVEGRAGEHPVELRRNRPTLRRRDRVVTVTGDDLSWRNTSTLRTEEIRDARTDVVVWRGGRGRDEILADTDPHHVALVMALLYAQVPQTLSLLNVIGYI